MSRLYLKFFCSAALLCSGFLSAVPAQSPAPRRNAAASQQSVAATEETQVAVVLSIISVPESFWEEMPLDLSLDAKSAPNHVAFMNDVQTDRFMEALQGNARTNVMASPKLTMFDGQASTITVGETQYFVTGVDMHWTGENMMAVPDA